MTANAGSRLIQLGHIAGLFGVRGWVRVFSETQPRENILAYRPWYLGTAGELVAVAEGQRQGKGLVARLEGCTDRDQAARLVGLAISVRRDQLPPPQADEYYWIDLEGLAVCTTDGAPLGVIDYLFSTGANDVMVTQGERERLVPFVWDAVVKDVDFQRGLVTVDWDPDF